MDKVRVMGTHATNAIRNHTRNTQGEHVSILRVFFETWRFPAQNIITNCSQCEVPRRTAAGMEPVQKDHATVNFPGCKALPREAPIA